MKKCIIKTNKKKVPTKAYIYSRFFERWIKLQKNKREKIKGMLTIDWINVSLCLY